MMTGRHAKSRAVIRGYSRTEKDIEQFEWVSSVGNKIIGRKESGKFLYNYRSHNPSQYLVKLYSLAPMIDSYVLQFFY